MSTAFISVGIDVGADFSYMSIALPNQTLTGKPLKITHAHHDSLEKAVSIIKEAEKLHSLNVRVIMESTGVYHYPLFCYLRDKGLCIHIINPIISKNSTNINIRKVHNDKFDSKKLALIGLKPDLKTSIVPSEKVLDLRTLVREYYNIMDSRSSYVYKIMGILKVAIPQYTSVFSKVTTQTSLALLDAYPSASELLSAGKDEIWRIIRKTSRFGDAYADAKSQAVLDVAHSALLFGCVIPSHRLLIRQCVTFIKMFDDEIANILASMHRIIDNNPNDDFVAQIKLIESIPGAGFLSAVTVVCEIGDFNAFKSPKQLFAYFGLDPAVNQSGKFVGTRVKMSKRGSRIARRAIYSIALVSISIKRNGITNNSVLREYYLDKCKYKPKLVALGAIMHKVCNIIFAVLRDRKPFVLTTTNQHKANYSQRLNVA
jgi:transposase